MGIVDDVYGGYENLAAFTGPDGSVDFEGAYYAGLDDHLEGADVYNSEEEEELTEQYSRRHPKETRALVLREGAKVVLQGLKAAHFNGKKGSLVEWLSDKGRWVVNFGSGDNTLLKPENLQLAPGEVIGDGGDVLICAELAPDPTVWDHALHVGLAFCGMESELLEASDAPFASLAQNLRQFRCLVLLGVGSGVGTRDLLSCAPFEEALSEWVRGGGHLILQGRDGVDEVLRWCDKDWQVGARVKASYQLGEAGVSLLSDLHGGDPSDFIYVAKAVTLKTVPEAERVLYEDPDKTAVAHGRCGSGAVTFIGDVNGETDTLKIISIMADPSALRPQDENAKESGAAARSAARAAAWGSAPSGNILTQVRALAAKKLPDKSDGWCSLDRHHAMFTPNGRAWKLMVQAYAGAVMGSHDDLKLLEQMAASASTGGVGGRGESDIAKYLLGKVYGDTAAMRNLRRPVDLDKAARYWLAAAEKGLAYGLCGLAFMASTGELPGLANSAPDYRLAMDLWANALYWADVPEAAYNIGVCFGLGYYGGPPRYAEALDWYCTARDCDLDGRGRAEDAAVVASGRHGSLTALHTMGPDNGPQAEFLELGARNALKVAKKVLEQAEEGDVNPEHLMLAMRAIRGQGRGQ